MAKLSVQCEGFSMVLGDFDPLNEDDVALAVQSLFVVHRRESPEPDGFCCFHDRMVRHLAATFEIPERYLRPDADAGPVGYYVPPTDSSA